MPHGNRSRQRESRAATASSSDVRPLLETTIEGAHSIIINFTGGHDMKIKRSTKPLRKSAKLSLPMPTSSSAPSRMRICRMISSLRLSRAALSPMVFRADRRNSVRRKCLCHPSTCRHAVSRTHRDRQLTIFLISFVRSAVTSLPQGGAAMCRRRDSVAAVRVRLIRR